MATAATLPFLLLAEAFDLGANISLLTFNS